MLKKQFLPAAVSLFSNRLLQSIPPAMEMIGAALQSKRGGGFDAEWQEIQNAIRFIKKSDPVLFDVGANVGNWSRGISRRLTAEGRSPRIQMFEPQPQCWPLLEMMSDVEATLHRTAVGDSVGSVSFYQGANSEVASVYKRSDFTGVEKNIEVPCITLDEFIEKNGIESVDYVKMDIEGHEFNALMGAQNSLNRKVINTISFEFGPANVNSRTFYLDFYSLLVKNGMKLYRMGHDGVPIMLNDYSRNLEYFNGVSNFIASFVEPDKVRRLGRTP